VLERGEKAVVLRLERRREARRGRGRLLRWALGVLLLAAALNLVVNMFLPARAPRAGTPPVLHDSRPLPAIEGPSGESRVELRFSHVASVVAGVGTEVRCWSVADWRKREAEWGNWHGRPLGAWGGYTTLWEPRIAHAYRIQLSSFIGGRATLPRTLLNTARKPAATAGGSTSIPRPTPGLEPDPNARRGKRWREA
jgi:hypothetical protein